MGAGWGLVFIPKTRGPSIESERHPRPPKPDPGSNSDPFSERLFAYVRTFDLIFPWIKVYELHAQTTCGVVAKGKGLRSPNKRVILPVFGRNGSD